MFMTVSFSVTWQAANLDDSRHPERMMTIIWPMGHSRDDKTRSHERIVEIAARRIREVGTDAPGVAEIMKTAGLTHGGFYKHFASRDELIAEAADRSFTDGSRRISELVEGAEDPLGSLVEGYLSAEHRDAPGSGCGVAALSGDAARADDRLRQAYTAQVSRYIDRLEGLLPSTGSPDEDRERATVAVSTLVGSLLMARAVDDPALADEILTAARNSLLTRTANADS
jgi:TetR/AcrR family transcriptional repressor of nem operon